MKTGKGLCENCGKRRRVARITGDGIASRGVNWCRYCTQGFKLAQRKNAGHDVGRPVKVNF